jgi:hypothetical protein
MSAQFWPCPGCSRHVKRGDAICPFCGATASVDIGSTRVLAGRLSRAALFAAGAVGTAVATTDCSTSSVQQLAPDAMASAGSSSGAAVRRPLPALPDRDRGLEREHGLKQFWTIRSCRIRSIPHPDRDRGLERKRWPQRGGGRREHDGANRFVERARRAQYRRALRTPTSPSGRVTGAQASRRCPPRASTPSAAVSMRCAASACTPQVLGHEGRRQLRDGCAVLDGTTAVVGDSGRRAAQVGPQPRSPAGAMTSPAYRLRSATRRLGRHEKDPRGGPRIAEVLGE